MQWTTLSKPEKKYNKFEKCEFFKLFERFKRQIILNNAEEILKILETEILFNVTVG